MRAITLTISSLMASLSMAITYTVDSVTVTSHSGHATSYSTTVGTNGVNEFRYGLSSYSIQANPSTQTVLLTRAGQCQIQFVIKAVSSTNPGSHQAYFSRRARVSASCNYSQYGGVWAVWGSSSALTGFGADPDFTLTADIAGTGYSGQTSEINETPGFNSFCGDDDMSIGISIYDWVQGQTRNTWYATKTVSFSWSNAMDAEFYPSPTGPGFVYATGEAESWVRLYMIDSTQIYSPYSESHI